MAIIEKDYDEIVKEVRFYLSFHKGKDNAISRWELVEKVFGREAAANRGNNNPFDRKVRDVISEYRHVDFICSSSGHSGYWLATTLNDVNALADELEDRAKEILAKVSDVRKRGVERFGPQMPLI